jgi:hypothetical protein
LPYAALEIALANSPPPPFGGDASDGDPNGIHAPTPIEVGVPGVEPAAAEADVVAGAGAGAGVDPLGFERSGGGGGGGGTCMAEALATVGTPTVANVQCK